MAAEQMRPKVARFRARWRAHQHRLDPRRLIFIDEPWNKTNMTRTSGWAPCGERLTCHAPFGHWRTQTFIAALRHDRLDAPWVIDGPINRDLFDLYIQTQLAPTPQPGDAILLDNLSSHKSPKAAAILRDIGAWFLPLPPLARRRRRDPRSVHRAVAQEREDGSRHAVRAMRFPTAIATTLVLFVAIFCHSQSTPGPRRRRAMINDIAPRYSRRRM